jgi:hypothetical protein
MESQLGTAQWGAGILWYTRESYDKMRSLVDDPDMMAATYDEWRLKVERSLELLKKTGVVFHKIKVDPEHFVLWCDTQNIKRDAYARKVYSSIEGLTIYQGEN